MLFDQEVGPFLLECFKLCLLGQVPITSLSLQVLGVLGVKAKVFVEGDTSILQEGFFASTITLSLYLLTLTKQAI